MNLRTTTTITNVWDYAVVYMSALNDPQWLGNAHEPSWCRWDCPAQAQVPEDASLRDGCELLGRQGWELVSVTTHPRGDWGRPGSVAGVVYTLFFKRRA